MELIFVEPKGFCFGVRRAITALEESLESHGRVYALGSPIHNPQEVERLLSKGLEIIETPSEVPPGGTVFIRAHGISDCIMEELRARNARVLDGTCPFVSRAKEKAALLAREGYTVLILGNKDHPEVRALRQSPEGSVIVVEPGHLADPAWEGLERLASSLRPPSGRRTWKPWFPECPPPSTRRGFSIPSATPHRRGRNRWRGLPIPLMVLSL